MDQHEYTVEKDWTTNTYLLTYLLTYLFAPWSKVLLEKLTGFQLVKKFLAFYGNQMFITAFTTPVPILSHFDPVHAPTSHFLKIHLNIILPSTPGDGHFLSLNCVHVYKIPQNGIFVNTYQCEFLQSARLS
jgi:hypothetical protein